MPRVSLRDVREAAFRALSAHGASNGEARTAAALVLDAEIVDGVGLDVLVEDLGRERWSRTPVQIAPVTDHRQDQEADAVRGVVLGSMELNRLLREGPLAVELLVGDRDIDAVALPCAVATASLLDSTALEMARISGTDVAVIARSATTGTGDPGPDGPDAKDRIRLATPDGRVGVGTIPLPSAHRELMDQPGVLVLRNVDRHDLVLSWTTAEERARARSTAAEQGLAVGEGVWRQVYDASRRYLVPG